MRTLTRALPPDDPLYSLLLNSGVVVGRLVTRTDAGTLPLVPAPATPAGTRSVTLTLPGQSPGSYATLKHLTLNGNVGYYSVPAGSYGNFLANGGSGFILGVVGATQPVVYGLDGHHNVRYLTDLQGNITDAYAYDAFGNLIAQSGPTPNNYLFTAELPFFATSRPRQPILPRLERRRTRRECIPAGCERHGTWSRSHGALEGQGPPAGPGLIARGTYPFVLSSNCIRADMARWLMNALRAARGWRGPPGPPMPPGRRSDCPALFSVVFSGWLNAESEASNCGKETIGSLTNED